MTSSHGSKVHPGDVSPTRSRGSSSDASEPRPPWYTRFNRRCKKFFSRKKKRTAEELRQDARKVHVARMEEARKRDMDLEDQRKSGKTPEEWREMQDRGKEQDEEEDEDPPVADGFKRESAD